MLMRVNEHMELSRNNFDSWILSYCLESIEVTKVYIDFFVSLPRIIIYIHVNFNRMKNWRLLFELNVGVFWEICLRIISLTLVVVHNCLKYCRFYSGTYRPQISFYSKKLRKLLNRLRYL